MKPEKTKPQDQEAAAVNSNPTLYHEAIIEVVDEYERSANADKPTELAPATQKELGEVERELEDSVLGVENTL